MRQAVLCVSLAAFAASPLAAVAQAPKTAQSIYGIWELKTVTINGKNVPKGAKELSEMLKLCGGLEIGMVYKIRRNHVMTMNGKDCHFDYMEETKEFDIEFPNEKGEDGGMGMDVKLAGKNLKLSFKDRERKVEMTFAPDE